jgi:D-psicose/D-tagatose/L-ribulose 3-epimerase
MKLGINLFLWADHMHDGLMPVLESLKRIGYDGVELPIFDLDEAEWQRWGRRLDDLGLERTANTVIAPEHNPLSPDPSVRATAYRHMQSVIDCCVAVGSPLLCGPHQVALGVFTGSGPTEAEWSRSVEHLRRVAQYAAEAGVTLAEEVVNRFELYHVNTLDEGIHLVDEVGHPNCRIHYDTFHAHIEEKSQAAAIRTVKPVLAHVHISENDRGTPGTGQVNWDAAFATLAEIGYDGWMVIEAFGRALPDLAAATKVWRDLFPSPEDVYTKGLAFMKQRVAAKK